MFYKPITIREAIEKVNETWFLPAIQRPYDWGERTRKEQFIYKLFDSILRRYPIGTLIIWETGREIPFRNFLADYNSEKLEKIRDKGLWGRKDKLLVYDGQQRLQSLYACLKYSFHGKILCYNLLFDPDSNREPRGFKFFDKHKQPDPAYVKLNELYSCNRKQEVEFEQKVLGKLAKLNLSGKDKLIVRKNLKNLWTVLVEEEIQLLSYYPLRHDFEEKEVLDIFKRINTTGMQLTKSEILFSELKRIKFDFEERLWDASSGIKNETNGFSFGPDNMLKVLFLLLKGGVRVDPERLDEEDLNKFIDIWPGLKQPLKSFFYDFLYTEFKINHEKIIRFKDALIPLIVYFYYMKLIKGYKFKHFSNRSIKDMKKYLIMSQLNFWDLQSYTDNFHKIIKDLIEKAKKKSDLNFPYKKFKNFVKKSKKREYQLKVKYLEDEDLRWFVLKILTSHRQYNYIINPDERFNPEIDHIFPKTPSSDKDYPKKYYKWVYTIWNMQPVKGEINASKLNSPPQDFFTRYPIYLKEYDFLPTKNIKKEIWSDKKAADFIKRRKSLMIRFIKRRYKLNIS